MRQVTMPSGVDRRWFTTDNAMEYLGVSRRWLERARTSAKLHYYKVGGTVFYAKHDLDKLVEKNKVI